MRVGLREANQRFSQLVRAVKLGREVILTERGKAVVVMRPAPAPAGEEAAVRLLEASGVLRGAQQAPCARSGLDPSGAGRSRIRSGKRATTTDGRLPRLLRHERRRQALRS